MPDSNTQQEVPTLVRYRTLTDRLDAIDTKIVAAAFDIDALAASGALDGVDLVAVSQSGTEKKATLAAVWRQDVASGGTVTQGTGPGTVASGFAISAGVIGSYGDGAFAHGFAYGGTISAQGNASSASGYTYGAGSLIQAGPYAGGGVARGVAIGGSIEARGFGSTATGRANSASSIVSSGGGSFANGYADGVGSGVYAASGGGFVTGYAGSGGYIGSTGTGAVAFGRATNNGELTASGIGSFAGGLATGTGDILSSAYGSFAFGWAYGGDIVASAYNSVQFGPGTNAQADSLSVGGTVRLKGTVGAPGTPRNGDQWVANNYVYIRSNGVSVKIT